MRRSANPEAIAHLTKAQELLNALPERPDRLQQELGAPACDWHASHRDQRVRFSRGGNGVCAGSRNL